MTDGIVPGVACADVSRTPAWRRITFASHLHRIASHPHRIPSHSHPRHADHAHAVWTYASLRAQELELKCPNCKIGLKGDRVQMVLATTEPSKIGAGA
jgi:hypothetical protein